MKQKVFVLALAVLIFGLNQTIGQSAATSQGSHLISGMFSFTSQGGDLYNNFDDKPQNTIIFTPSYYNFVIDQLGVGGDFSLNRVSQGDFSFTTIGVGPKLAYFFDSGGNGIPFIGGGFNYISIGDGDNTEGGFSTKIGGGIMVRKGHLGVSLEVGWLRESYKPDGATDRINGSTIFFGAGLVGFLFNG